MSDAVEWLQPSEVAETLFAEVEYLRQLFVEVGQDPQRIEAAFRNIERLGVVGALSVKLVGVQ